MMKSAIKTLCTVLALVILSVFPALAEGTSVTFGAIKADTSLPVEVQADTLSVNQSDGRATFSGNVLVSQGEMRLTANEILVEYGADGKGIARLYATGQVLLVNATDAVEAAQAVYTIATGEVVLSGEVLLTQGKSAISAGQMVIDLKSGTGQMTGRVTTTFTPGSN